MPPDDDMPTGGAASQSAPPTAGRVRRRVVRRLADFLLIAGGLVLSYPFWSAGYAAVHQRGLEAEYLRGSASFAPLAVGLAEAEQAVPTATQVRRLARAYGRDLRAGDPIGRLRIPRIGLDRLVQQGTRAAGLDPAADEWLLRKGPVHYATTPLPGEGEPFAVAGHRTTYGAPFNKLDRLRRGDRVIVETPYARFVYSVARTTVVRPTEVAVLRDRGYGLVLTTCTPPYSASRRLIVWAELRRAEPRSATASPAP